ncbi:MAG: hypothetical protein ACTXOO_04405 [Sodalis sp. (in: enterobacteria)]
MGTGLIRLSDCQSLFIFGGKQSIPAQRFIGGLPLYQAVQRKTVHLDLATKLIAGHRDIAGIEDI